MSPARPRKLAPAALRAWFDAAPDAMLASDANGTIVLANALAARLFGHRPGRLAGLAIAALLHPRASGAGVRRTRTATRGPAPARELTGVRRGGPAFPVEVTETRIDVGREVLTVAAVRDISATRRFRQAVAHARRDGYTASISRLALESPDYKLAIRRILQLTCAALEIPAATILATDWHRSTLLVRASTGLTAEATRTLATIVAESDLIAGVQATASQPPRAGDTRALDVPAPLHAGFAALGFPDAALLPLAGRHEPLGVLVALADVAHAFDRDKLGFLQSIADLLASAVQRSRAEEQLAHAQRLDAVGQLTGGIAHDFNNLLTVVSGNLQLLEAELAEHADARETIASALRAVDRGSDLTRRLLAFARRQPLQPRPVVPKPLVDELGHMLRRTLGEAVAVATQCEADVPDVYADANELDTALVNLALNARDAMSRGGRLAVAARTVTLASADNAWKLAPGRYVAFEVADTGTGMAPDVQAHALEPFFTTKESGKGSGLGLSMVYGFVTQSGGALTIDSRLGYGTRVTFLLPVADAAPRPAPQAGPARGEAVAERATVLVVEDEPDVLTVAARFLRAIGYDVLTAGDARSALALLAGGRRVDLLFSDVVLGDGMTGAELAREARRTRPGLAVLLTSGYERAALARREDAADFPLLRKPYRREQLLDAVRHALARA